MRVFDQATLAYTAGIIDGEGTIGIGGGTSRTNYFSFVSMDNTDKKLVEWMQSLFGGGFYGPYEGKGNRKEVWAWRLHGPKAAHFVTLIRPYLKVKATQAWIALEFREQCDWSPKGRGGLSKEETALREGYFLIMKALNKRGR